MSKTAKIVTIVLTGLVLICSGGIVIAALGVNEAVQEAETALEETQSPEVQPSVAPAPFKAVTIKTGIHTVGKDIPAGTYKTVDVVGSLCSWQLTMTGSNGSDYINAGVPMGGRPEVTVKVGQDFQSTGCGSWRRIR